LNEVDVSEEEIPEAFHDVRNAEGAAAWVDSCGPVGAAWRAGRAGVTLPLDRAILAMWVLVVIFRGPACLAQGFRIAGAFLIGSEGESGWFDLAEWGVNAGLLPG
jgi:hypothetical protein